MSSLWVVPDEVRARMALVAWEMRYLRLIREPA